MRWSTNQNVKVLDVSTTTIGVIALTFGLGGLVIIVSSIAASCRRMATQEREASRFPSIASDTRCRLLDGPMAGSEVVVCWIESRLFDTYFIDCLDGRYDTVYYEQLEVIE